MACGVESTSRGDARKDQQQTVGSKASAEEIGDALRTECKSLSETPRTASTQNAKQLTNQTNKTGNKQRQDRG
jgi:hypothetical protein